MTHADAEVEESAAYSLLAGVETAEATAETNMEALTEARTRPTTHTTGRSPHPTVEILAHPCSLVCCCIHNSQEIDTACVSIRWWVDNGSVLRLHREILFRCQWRCNTKFLVSGQSRRQTFRVRQPRSRRRSTVCLVSFLSLNLQITAPNLEYQ